MQLSTVTGQGEGRRSLSDGQYFRMQEVVLLLLSTVLLSPPELAQGRGGGHDLTVNIFRMQEVVFLLLSTVSGQGEGRQSLPDGQYFQDARGGVPAAEYSAPVAS
jgi:hypothetical protein